MFNNKRNNSARFLKKYRKYKIYKTFLNNKTNHINKRLWKNSNSVEFNKIIVKINLPLII